MLKVLVTTVPFGNKNMLPFELMASARLECIINPLNRKVTSDELAEMIRDIDILIAGTEIIDKNVFDRANKLKFISRVGIGLDGIDLSEAERKGVQVSYTPDAPAPAVAELTIGLMLSLLRNIHIANVQMHNGVWHRHFGRRIPEVTIGIIGAGRIGGRVLRRLAAFGSPRVLVNDIKPTKNIADMLKLEWVDKETIFREADVISFHVPLTGETRNMVGYNELKIMKKDALIINTSRGGIINEGDLAAILSDGHLAGAAIDVFEQEPYAGPLDKIERCLLTSHMGSMSLDCRIKMEIEATEEVVRFAQGLPLESTVPRSEYNIQGQR